jgi:hypothetical protein
MQAAVSKLGQFNFQIQTVSSELGQRPHEPIGATALALCVSVIRRAVSPTRPRLATRTEKTGANDRNGSAFF